MRDFKEPLRDIPEENNTIDRYHKSIRLRQTLLDVLLQQGFAMVNGQLVPPDPSCKDNIRQLYVHLRKEKLREAEPWLRSVEDKLLPCFANGTEVDVKRIRPILEFVDTQFKTDLFRYGSLLWSVPVSTGYGRRMRFLVFDEYNGKLIGLFALGDPVYNLRARDHWIGWKPSEKNDRLYHVMEAYVLGAVSPYSYLLGGKLVALLAASNEVREMFQKRYAQQTSVLRKVVRPPHLVLLSTTSALGRSSLYNRLSINGRRVFISVGYTKGWGHFHFSNTTFEQIKAYLREIGEPVVRQYKYGGGPNWRFRVLRRCLIHLGLSPELLHHGIKREIFVVPLASNAQAFLRGEETEPTYYEMPKDSVFEYFKHRWLLPRAAWDQHYQTFNRESIRLSRQLKEKE